MPYGNIYRPDQLFLPQQGLLRFAAGAPTPFFLYNEDGIRKTARTIQGSFCWNPGHRPWFPLMANCTPAVLRILREEGFGVLAQSEGELLLARRCGFSGDEILLHTPAMSDSLAALAKELGCGVIFDSPGQIEKMADRLPKRCLLRYHPGKMPNGADFTANTDKNKSGMSSDQIYGAAALLCRLGVEEIGLHCHLAANAQSETYYPAAAALQFSFAVQLQDQLGICISCCDLGGGIGINKPLQNLPRIGTMIREHFRTAFPGSNGPALYTELGRYALGRHGSLVSRVVEVRERSRRYMILDASAAELPRLVLHRGNQHISVVGDCTRQGRLVYSVHGCTADSLDRFNDRAVLPEVAPGTLVAIHGVGAYGESARCRLCMLPDRESYLYTREGLIVSAAMVKA